MLKPVKTAFVTILWVVVGPALGGELILTGLTDPAPVNPDAATDTWVDGSPCVATDGAGNWLCVWQSTNPLGGTIGDDPDILVSWSTDGGATWSAPMPVNSDAAVDGIAGDSGPPRIATDGAGTWVVVWVRSGDPNSPTGPDPEIMYARSTDVGLTWSPPAVLNSTAAIDGNGSDLVPDVATDGKGTWICVWHSDASVLGAGTDRDIFYAVSTGIGQSWGPTALLNSRGGMDWPAIDSDPTIASNGGGTWICAWDSQNDLGGQIGDDYDILFAVSTNDGANWSPQAVVNSTAYTDNVIDQSPSVAVGPDGTWVIAWNTYDLSGLSDADILYATSVNAGGSWSAAAPLHTDAATDIRTDGGAQLRVDVNGNWIALSSSAEVVDGRTQDTDLYFVTSCDPLAGWSGPGVLNTNAFMDAAEDRKVSPIDDGAGYWVAAWNRFNLAGDEYGTDFDIFAARFELGRLGDFDFDGDVDLTDFAQFARCFAGSLLPPATSCREGIDADFDDDGDVDIADFSSFAENFTGAR